VLGLAVFTTAHANLEWRRVTFQKRFLHSWQAPVTQGVQYGRARYSDWRSAPQHTQNGDVTNNPLIPPMLPVFTSTQLHG
jgi:hypothetical protein